MPRKDKTRILLRSLGFACIAAGLSVQIAWAGIDPQPFRTGLFGVVAGQAVRVSVVNAGEAAGTINPCFRIWSAAGVLLAETDAGPLPRGVGTFVDFIPTPPSGAPVRNGLAQVWAEVELVPAVRPARLAVARAVLRRQVLVSLEVFDIATGSTVYTTPFAAVAGIEPQPFAPVAGIEPTPFRTGLFGVTAGQSIRVSIVNGDDAGGIIEPCFRVFDAAGMLLFEGDAGPLPGGMATSMEFDPVPPTGGPPRPIGFRAQVRAEVELVPAVHPPDPIAGRLPRRPKVHLTLEVFDTATDRTIYTMPFAKVGFNPQPEPPESIQ